MASGGTREGAGRKKLGNIPISVRVRPETKERLQEMAAERGLQIGAVIDAIVKECSRA